MNKRLVLIIVAIVGMFMVTMASTVDSVFAQSVVPLKPVSATAQVNNADAPKTLDDNPNEFSVPTYWQAAGTNPCITFDLGQARQIVGFRETAGPFPPNSFTFSIAMHPEHFTQIASGLLTQNAFGNHFFAPTNARYLQLCIAQNSVNGYGELADFRALIPGAGPKTIRDDATGGDCTLIGKWTAATKTCKLLMDWNDAIVIASNGITLDGDGHTIAGGATGVGITLINRADGTLKNLKVKGFQTGIYLQGSTKNTLSGLLVSGAVNEGILFQGASTYNKVLNTTVLKNRDGINLGDQGSHHNSFERIIATLNTRLGLTGYAGSDYTRIVASHFDANGGDAGGFGILLGWSSNWSIEDCVASFNKGDGIQFDTASNSTIRDSMIFSNKGNGVAFAGLATSNNLVTRNRIYFNGVGLGFLSYATNNTVKENTVQHNGIGVSIIKNTVGPNVNNLIYNNDWAENTKSANVQETPSANKWDTGLPGGGNYWSDYHTPNQGCKDTNHNRFCDAPYTKNGVNDNYPWTTPHGWQIGKNK